MCRGQARDHQDGVPEEEAAQTTEKQETTQEGFCQGHCPRTSDMNCFLFSKCALSLSTQHNSGDRCIFHFIQHGDAATGNTDHTLQAHG